jgi:pimeloyl-ACP methyl ester carboxylesterase
MESRPRAPGHGGALIEPFTPAVHEAELEDLRLRLRATRWPEAETDPSQGVALRELQELCTYWCDGYDWRRCEERLGEIGQFRTEIDGLNIHFLHARSPRPTAVPLILTHGWPGSVIEFLDALQPLTEAGFDCVVPSLPGYGFSDKPAARGWGIERIARAWATLMARLGYDGYGAVGSDWGTSVSASLGQQEPQHVTGIHLMPPLVPPVPGTRLRREHRADEAGYSTLQRTRPQTIGYSLTDSPAGLDHGEGVQLERPPQRDRAGRAARQHHVLLAPLRRRVSREVVLGKPFRRRPLARRAARGARPCPLPRRLLDLPVRAAEASASRSGAAVHGHPLLERARARRPLRGVGATRALRHRGDVLPELDPLARRPRFDV